MEPAGAVVVHGGESSETSTLEINYFVKRICEAYAKVCILEEVCRVYRESPVWRFMIEPNSPSPNPAAVAQKKRRDEEEARPPSPRLSPRELLGQDLPGKAALKPDLSGLRAAKSRIPVISGGRAILPLEPGTPVRTAAANVFDLHREADIAPFFEHFRKVQRPAVHILPPGEPPLVLFNHFGLEALQLKKLSFNSPFETAFSGIVGLIELLLNQNMQREVHELEQKLKTADLGLKTLELAEKIVHIYRLIEDPATPWPMKQLLIHTLVGILDQQAKLNQNMGITRIDLEGQGSLDMRV